MFIYKGLCYTIVGRGHTNVWLIFTHDWCCDWSWLVLQWMLEASSPGWTEGLMGGALSVLWSGGGILVNSLCREAYFLWQKGFISLTSTKVSNEIIAINSVVDIKNFFFFSTLGTLDMSWYLERGNCLFSWRKGETMRKNNHLCFPCRCFSKIKKKCTRFHKANHMGSNRVTVYWNVPAGKWFGRDSFQNSIAILTLWSDFDKIHQRWCVRCRMVDKARHHELLLHSLKTQDWAGHICLVFLYDLGLSCGKGQTSAKSFFLIQSHTVWHTVWLLKLKVHTI